MGTIQITGKAARKVECDVLEYTLTFTRTKGSVSLAIEAVEKDMEKTLEALKNFGVAIEHIHVEKDSVDEGYSQKDTAVFECERKVRFRVKANNAFTNRVMDILKNNQISALLDTMKKTPRYPGNLLPGGIGDLFSIILIEYVLLNCFFTHISDRSDIIA